MRHLQLFFIYAFITLASINSVHAEEDLTGMDRVYLVITTSDMTEAFTTLTNYRETEKGGSYTTHIETMAFIEANYEGVDRAEKVRNYIKGSYKNHGTRFVVLGGDADGDMENHKVPMRGLYQRYEVEGEIIAEDTSVPSDRYYAYLDGSFNSDGDEFWGEIDDGDHGQNLDWHYDVAVGRIAADNSEEALNHINKIIAFETQNLPGVSILAGEKIYGTPTWGGDNLDRLMVCNNSEKLYDRDLESLWIRDNIITLINSDQYSQLHHSGHADVGAAFRMNIDDIPSLNNQNPMFIYTQGDYAAAVNHDDSFAEVITNGYPNNGAAAFIGSSSQTWLDQGYADSVWAHQMFQEFQYDAQYPIGVSLLIADLELRYGGYSNPGRWATLSTVLIGDPITQIYKPDTNTAPQTPIISGNTVHEEGFIKVNISIEVLDTDYDLQTIALFLNGQPYNIQTYNRQRIGYLSHQILLSEPKSEDMCFFARANDIYGNFSPISDEVCLTTNPSRPPVIDYVKINMQPGIQEIIAWVTDQNEDVEQVTCTFDDQYSTNAIKILDDIDTTHWECQIPDLLLDREHQVTVQAKDKTNLLSDISGPHTFKFQNAPELDFNIDTSTPELAVITGAAFDINKDLYEIKLQFNSNNYLVTANGTKDFSYIANLRPGSHTVTVTVIDQNGNTNLKEKSFTVTAACTEIVATNAEHESAGRAYTATETTGGFCFGTFCWGQKETTTWFAIGSDNNMGTSSDSETTLSEKPAEHFSAGSCPANSYAPVVIIKEWNIQEDGRIIISGTAIDPNDDLAGVMIEGDITEVYCLTTGTLFALNPEFTCIASPLAEGTYKIYANANDKLGNTGKSATVEIKIGIPEMCITATNIQHIQESRAYAGGTMNLYAYAAGSDDSLGMLGSTYYSTATSLRETSAGYWKKVGSCN